MAHQDDDKSDIFSATASSPFYDVVDDSEEDLVIGAPMVPEEADSMVSKQGDAKVMWENQTRDAWYETEEPLQHVSGRRIEDVSQYYRGGFHPVHLGDILDGRFEVVHKIGNGGYATVWLCLELDTSEWRAVKIATADYSEENESDVKVAKILRKAGLTSADWEACHLALPSEHFWIRGPNGRHICMVLPLLGPTLDIMIKADVGIIQDLAYQVAQGLQLLHWHGICHGDLRPDNILLRPLETTHTLSKNEMLTLIGQPLTDSIRTVSGLHPGPNYPEYIVDAADLRALGFVHEVAIIDFGIAFDPADPPRTVGIPHQYAAPEALFCHQPSFGVDVWSLASTILELRINRTFASTRDPAYVASLESLDLGPFPAALRPQVWKKIREVREAYGEALGDGGKFCDDWNEDDGPDGAIGPMCAAGELEARRERLRGFSAETGYTDPICARIAMVQHYREIPMRNDGSWERDEDAGLQAVEFKVPDDEVPILGDLIRGSYAFNPKERLTIGRVLRHEWFYHTSDVEPEVSPIGPRRGEARSGGTTWEKALRSGLKVVPTARRFLKAHGLTSIVSGMLWGILFWGVVLAWLRNAVVGI